MANRIYIRSAAQISVQKPLCEDWMTDPVRLSGEYLRSQDPDFKQFLNPMQARRMGLILKRAIAVSLTALKDAGIECPDAIFTGTGLGCMENTENFLSAMCRDGEEMLPPTYFMMSTHNTISSAVAILLRCHGYNCTYSQKDISFESALLDAFIQLQAGRMGNALVGSHDETTPDTYRRRSLFRFRPFRRLGVPEPVEGTSLRTRGRSDPPLTGESGIYCQGI